jgi:hypothetical protein
VPAATFLFRACNATFDASAFRGQGHVGDGSSAMSVDVYYGSAGTLVTVTEHGNQTVSVITYGPSTYMKANQTFWQSANPGAASQFAGRWIDVTSLGKSSLGGLNAVVDKRELLVSCGEGWSTAYVGNATFDGLNVIKIHQISHQRDGTSLHRYSSTYWVEKGPIPYIVRITSKGWSPADLVFSDYDVQPVISAPPGAIPISNVG